MMIKTTGALVRRPAHPLTASIETRILLIRGQKVMVDSDLADLYRVPTKVFNQAVKRNLKRFPKDFMFRLTGKEKGILRSKIVTSSWGGRRNLPYAFTEQGVAMLSSVLSSDRAVKVNIAIMRAFVRIREALSTHKDLALEIEKLKHEQQKQGRQIQQVFVLIEKMLEPAPEPEPAKRRFGFSDRSQE